VHATWAGTHKGPFRGIAATNKAISFEGMVFWRIADGKIAERWGILDMAAAMKQISD
jgi:predicted ester cyclase